MDKIPPQVTKAVRVFRFDPHPRRKLITIVGETLITVLKNGKTLKEVNEPLKKPVKLIGLNHNSRTDAIVNDVLQSCPFIEDNTSLRTSLQESIDELKNREYDGHGNAVTSCRAPDGSYLPRYPDIFDEVDHPTSSKIAQERADEVDVIRLNEYVEMLYEDIPKKIEGLRLISLLTKSPRYILAVVEHGSATNAIFRTLREDRRKNMNLTHQILSICHDFARMQCFHRFLIRHKLPSLILNILDYELERCEKWKVQLHQMDHVSQTEGTQKAFDGYVNANENFQSCVLLQNCILTLGFEILHYLSEDRIVNSALLHQGIVTSLTDTLDRMDFTLWESTFTHMRDLSPFKEHIEQFLNVDTLGKFAKVLKSKIAMPVKVARVCFGVLCNMSFHPSLRKGMITLGLLSVFSKCLGKSSLSDCIAKTLYLISMDPSSRAKLVKSGIIEVLLCQLTSVRGATELISRSKGALAANLAKEPTAAQQMGESIKISVLLKHAIKTQDTLAMKIIRNVVETSSSSLVDQQAGHIAKAVVEVNSLDFVLECVGILAHLNVEEVNFADLLKKNRLIIWLKRQIMNYMSMTNCLGISGQLKTATLEVVLFLSNICKKEEGARFIVGEGFVDQLLIRLLREPHTDPQIIQQIVYLFNVCCSHEAIATFLVSKTQFPQELMAFALRIGGQIRRQCEVTLHKLAEFEESWLGTMTEHEFLMYNESWTNNITEEEKRRVGTSSSFLKKRQAEDYRDIVQRAYNPYNSAKDDEEEVLFRTNSFIGDFLDDSTTDEESIFAPLSSRDHSYSEEKSGIHYSDFYELYRKEFQEEMALARDWQFFL